MLTETIGMSNLRNLQSIENFYEAVTGITGMVQVIFDFSKSKFLRPYATMAIVLSARYLAETTQHPVVFSNVPPVLMSYFGKINLFEMGQKWFSASKTKVKSARPHSDPDNHMELTTLSRYEDVITILKRVDVVFSDWVNREAQKDVYKVLDELCQNVLEHSGDPHVCVLIQKYSGRRSNLKNVCVAIGDLGMQYYLD